MLETFEPRVNTFQSTLPRGERLGSRPPSPACEDFNPRSREGSDRRAGGIQERAQISIHAPARGATGRVCGRPAHLRDFNPRSREGSDGRAGSRDPLALRISIHAPARGATVGNRLENRPELISIHAPARGATNARCKKMIKGQISIHAPARGATQIYGPLYDAIAISIHAPARGATSQPPFRCCRMRYFNPRSREGSDLYVRLDGRQQVISIHAPARGATSRRQSGAIAGHGYFNPRSREGSDRGSGSPGRSAAISIHAPARGATPIRGGSYNNTSFQSTLPRGERRYGYT